MQLPVSYRMIFFLFFAVRASVCTAQCIVPVEAYREASMHVLKGDYIGAEKAMDSFIGEHPDEPAGPLLKAAVLQYACTDYENFSREEEFLSLLDEAVKLAGGKSDEGEDDLWALYYMAAADGLRGVWSVTSGSLLRGIIRGRSGAKGMERIVEADSTFFDAYLMLGSYRFWRNVALRRISWLPFIEAEINGGLDDARLAIKRGRLTGPLSNTVLLEMLLDQDPGEAVSCGERLIADFPGCRLFAWQLGEAYKKLGRYDDAVSVFTGIAESMEKDEGDDGSGELRCWWKLAVLSKTVGNTDECVFYCRKVITLGERPAVRERQRKRIETAGKWLDEMTGDDIDQ